MLRGITVATRIEDAAARLEALGNPTRLAVYRLLVRAGEDGLSVGQLQKRLKLAGSTLSHHLRALITVDLVSQERQGTTLTCRANFREGTWFHFRYDCRGRRPCGPAEKVA